MARSLRNPILCMCALFVIGGTLLPATAEAGCFGELDSCMNCARKYLWEGIKGLSASLIRDANVMMWDCNLDVYHCIILGKHHRYGCAI